jgi:hypothetical protein
MKTDIELALTLTLNRIKAKHVSADLQDNKIKFSALLITWLSNLHKAPFFKQLFPDKGEMYNVLRVVDMVEDDLSLFDDPDIQEQLHIKKTKTKAKTIPIKSMDEIKRMKPNMSIYNDNGTEVIIFHPARMVLINNDKTKRVHKYNDFKKPSIITIDKENGIIHFHKHNRSALPPAKVQLCPKKLEEMMSFF